MLKAKVINTNLLLLMDQVTDFPSLLNSDLPQYQMLAIAYSNMLTQLAFTEVRSKFSEKEIEEYLMLKINGEDVEGHKIYNAVEKKKGSKPFLNKYGPFLSAFADNCILMFAAGALADQAELLGFSQADDDYFSSNRIEA